MAIANIRWQVDAVTLAALVAAGFDAWLVERQDGPFWAEISYETTRPPINAAALTYLYTDPSGPVDAITGEASGNYRATPYRTSDAATDVPIGATKARRGYITPDDVWAEGYANPPWTPALVWRGIDRATNTIDALCRQWFEPRYSQFSFDGTGHDQLWLDLPIAALHAMLYQDDTVVEVDDFEVYNRHLTRGQLNPDDRASPKVTYADDLFLGSRRRRSSRYRDGALFGSGRKNVILKGIFGYTELGPGDIAAETVVHSQIPISYGQTPSEIVRACLLLTLTYMLPADEQQEAALASRITKVKTRDQWMEFADPGGGGANPDASYGLTGNIEVDNILMRYSGPIRMGGIG